MLQAFCQGILNEHKKYSEDAKKWFSNYNYSSLKAETLSPFISQCEYFLKNEEADGKAFYKSIIEYYNNIIINHNIAVENYNNHNSSSNRYECDCLHIKYDLLDSFAIQAREYLKK